LAQVQPPESSEAATGRHSSEDSARTAVYRLLAHLLGRIPSAETLALVAKLTGAPQTPLGAATQALSLASQTTDAEQVSDEFHALFIGVGRGELLPYGSYYLTGFLHEKPLARLRQDMARLGVARREDVKEPEDHIASVCEMMAGLIDGSLKDLDLEAQQAFFETHLGSWAGHFFSDLENAKSAKFYVAVGALGRVFLEIEEESFRMA